MNELQLKYGCNPNQTPSRIYMADGSDLPIKVLSGRPGYINFMDAFNGWQLVRDLKKETGLPAATSFKHVSPAGAAIGKPMSDVLKKIYWVDDCGDLSPLACAYARARGADRMSSFGDFISLSDVCDVDTARLIKREVSDGVIAPGYTEEALEILKSKKNGNYVVIEIDENYVPDPIERRQIFGITFEQGRQELKIDDEMFANIVTKNKDITPEAINDLKVAMITLKYTQSNSVCYVKDGQAIGIGAGQQSRVHCVRLAGSKADNWWLRQAPQVLNLPFIDGIRRADRDNAIDVYIGAEYEDVLADGAWQRVFKEKPPVFTAEEKRAWLDQMSGITLGSDAFFPFSDNIERAHKSGVQYIAEPGGSVRDDAVIECADKYNMVMAFTGIRLFHH
ncbi:MAG: phosphoribosylaminoimidazolecarboxamide formyltransferase [Eubacterium sp.]|nr:phosphoribosylaminoimidazolecarboxamide formyltransferase [Eubacterium sp.]